MTVLSKLAAGLALLIAAAAPAAPITWQTPVAIVSAEQSLFAPGSIQYAVAWTGQGPTSVTLADNSVVNFQDGAVDGTGTIQVQGAFGICGTNCAQYSGTGNAAFNAAVGGFAYDGVQTITLTGLTVGRAYSLQIFSIDDRDCCGFQTQFWNDPNGNVSQGYQHNQNAFILGTFLADTVTQTFQGSTLPSDICTVGQCTNLNAVVLRSGADVPEPATLGLLVLGIAGIAVGRRKPTA